MNVSPFVSVPELKRLLSAMMVWSTLSLFTQVMVVPFDTVRVLGLNAKFSIETVFVAELDGCWVQPERRRTGTTALTMMRTLIFFEFSFSLIEQSSLHMIE